MLSSNPDDGDVVGDSATGRDDRLNRPDRHQVARHEQRVQPWLPGQELSRGTVAAVAPEPAVVGDIGQPSIVDGVEVPGPPTGRTGVAVRTMNGGDTPAADSVQLRHRRAATAGGRAETRDGARRPIDRDPRYRAARRGNASVI